MSEKAPAFQFYPGDWRRDIALQSCSLAARGLWHECLCLMHDGDPYGHLAVNGNALTVPQIARMVGEREYVVAALLDELEAAGVFSRADDGTIFSRRMVRDGKLREVRREAGKRGGNPVLVNQNSSKTEATVQPKHEQTGKQKPTPASASATATAKEKEPTPTPPARGRGLASEPIEIPEWVPAEAWRAYCEMRLKIRKPLTPRAVHLAIQKLSELRASGQDPGAVLDQSVLNSWQGIFPLRSETGHGSTRTERNAAAAQRALEILEERDRARAAGHG